MDNKTKPWKVYTIANLNNSTSETNYTTKKEVEINPQWGENAKLFHVIETYRHPTFEDLPIYKTKNGQCYYLYTP